MKEDNLIELGYSDKVITKMIKKYPILRSVSKENAIEKIDYLKSLGYTNDQVLKITINCPSVLSYSIETLNKKISDLEDIGYTKKDIIKMILSFTLLFSYSIENIKKKINDLIDLGYSKEEVINMTKELPALFSYSIENIKEKIDFLKSINLGFLVTKDARKLIQSVELTYAIYMYFKEKNIVIDESNYQKLFNGKIKERLGITKEELLEKYPYDKNKKEEVNDKMNKKDYFISLGYTAMQIEKMDKAQPSLLSYSIEKIDSKIKFLLSLGYTMDDIFKISLVYPAIYSYSIEKIGNRLNDLIDLEYTKEEVISMTIKLPPLFGYDFSKIERKINFLKDVNLDFIVLFDTKQLMQSIELTYARYMYFKENGKIIDETNYKYLFESNKKFEKRSNMTKEELLEKYNYEEYIKEKNDTKKEEKSL